MVTSVGFPRRAPSASPPTVCLVGPRNWFRIPETLQPHGSTPEPVSSDEILAGFYLVSIPRLK